MSQFLEFNAVNRSKFTMNEHISQRMAGSNSALPPKACIADTAWTFVLRPVSIERWKEQQ